MGAGDNGVVGGRVSDGGGVGEVVSRVAGDFSLHFLRWSAQPSSLNCKGMKQVCQVLFS